MAAQSGARPWAEASSARLASSAAMKDNVRFMERSFSSLRWVARWCEMSRADEGAGVKGALIARYRKGQSAVGIRRWVKIALARLPPTAPHEHSRIPGKTDISPFRRRDAARRAGHVGRRGGGRRAEAGRVGLGREGADPRGRTRQGRRREGRQVDRRGAR